MTLEIFKFKESKVTTPPLVRKAKKYLIELKKGHDCGTYELSRNQIWAINYAIEYIRETLKRETIRRTTMKKMLIVCDLCKTEYSLSSDTVAGVLITDANSMYQYHIVLDADVSQANNHICRYCFEAIKKKDVTFPF
jgi:hypothetical protein